MIWLVTELARAGYNFYQSDAGSKVLLEFFGILEPNRRPRMGFA